MWRQRERDVGRGIVVILVYLLKHPFVILDGGNYKSREQEGHIELFFSRLSGSAMPRADPPKTSVPWISMEK
jgi:hypothetical protein